MQNNTLFEQMKLFYFVAAVFFVIFHFHCVLLFSLLHTTDCFVLLLMLALHLFSINLVE